MSLELKLIKLGHLQKDLDEVNNLYSLASSAESRIEWGKKLRGIQKQIKDLKIPKNKLPVGNIK